MIDIYSMTYGDLVEYLDLGPEEARDQYDRLALLELAKDKAVQEQDDQED